VTDIGTTWHADQPGSRRPPDRERHRYRLRHPREADSPAEPGYREQRRHRVRHGAPRDRRLPPGLGVRRDERRDGGDAGRSGPGRPERDERPEERVQRLHAAAPHVRRDRPRAPGRRRHPRDAARHLRQRGQGERPRRAPGEHRGRGRTRHRRRADPAERARAGRHPEELPADGRPAVGRRRLRHGLPGVGVGRGRRGRRRPAGRRRATADHRRRGRPAVGRERGVAVAGPTARRAGRHDLQGQRGRSRGPPPLGGRDCDERDAGTARGHRGRRRPARGRDRLRRGHLPRVVRRPARAGDPRDAPPRRPGHGVRAVGGHPRRRGRGDGGHRGPDRRRPRSGRRQGGRRGPRGGPGGADRPAAGRRPAGDVTPGPAGGPRGHPPGGDRRGRRGRLPRLGAQRLRGLWHPSVRQPWFVGVDGNRAPVGDRRAGRHARRRRRRAGR